MGRILKRHVNHQSWERVVLNGSVLVLSLLTILWNLSRKAESFNAYHDGLSENAVRLTIGSAGITLLHNGLAHQQHRRDWLQCKIDPTKA